MGINMNDAFPSKWLKAADFPQPQIVTISAVTMEDIGDDHKPVIWIEGEAKGIVLNKTNASNISVLYGNDSDGWIGKTMEVNTQYVDFQGKSTLSIRLYPPRNQGNASQQAQQSGDPRGDIPPSTDPNGYGAQRG